MARGVARPKAYHGLLLAVAPDFWQKRSSLDSIAFEFNSSAWGCKNALQRYGPHKYWLVCHISKRYNALL
jgi:hypothetical protein